MKTTRESFNDIVQYHGPLRIVDKQTLENQKVFVTFVQSVNDADFDRRLYVLIADDQPNASNHHTMIILRPTCPFASRRQELF